MLCNFNLVFLDLNVVAIMGTTIKIWGEHCLEVYVYSIPYAETIKSFHVWRYMHESLVDQCTVAIIGSFSSKQDLSN